MRFRKYIVNIITTIESFWFHKRNSSNQSLYVSKNCKYLTRPDGTTFIWLGDTAWELFHKLNREDVLHYLNDRSKKRFTIIQAVILAELNGLTTPNAYGHLPLINQDPTLPNPSYFEHVDFIVNEAEKLGLFIGMLPTWGDKVTTGNGGEPVIFNKENAFAYGEFLGKRYKYKPIVWILGGDRNTNNKKEKIIWQFMAKGLRAGDEGRHLISYHPQGGASSYQMMANERILDFNMYQSGHHKRFNDVYSFCERLSSSIPRKPYIDAEPAYEDIPVSFGEFLNWNDPARVPSHVINYDNTIKDKSYFQKGFFTDYDIRVHAFWNFLSGACGYTYGTNAIWQMFKKNSNYAIPCVTDWREALDLPGSLSIAHIREFFESYPFEKAVSCQKLIAQKNPVGQNHIRAAKASDNSFILVYLSVGQPVALKTKKINYNLRWFNPKSGLFTKPISITGKGRVFFSPPSSGIGHDWLLILDKEM